MSVTNGQTTALAPVREQATALGLSGSVQITGLRDVFALAERLAHAKGFVPRSLLGDPNGIAAAILTGIELGMGPMESMRSIHMVEGKPTMSADLMLARAIRAGVRIEWEKTDNSAAIVKLERAGMRHRHSFTEADAKLAGLWGKNNWAKYPAAMLRARCISGAMRAFCPDVLGSQVYVEGELEGDNTVPDEPVRAEVVREPDAIQAPQRRETEVDGELVLMPNTFAECRSPGELRAFCADKRDALSVLVNGQRANATAKAKEAAERCGCDPFEVLDWCGLA